MGEKLRFGSVTSDEDNDPRHEDARKLVDILINAIPEDARTSTVIAALMDLLRKTVATGYEEDALKIWDEGLAFNRAEMIDDLKKSGITPIDPKKGLQ